MVVPIVIAIVLLFIKVLLCLLALFGLIIVGEKVRLLLTKGVCTCKVDLSGKTILITGGNAGIGLQTAIILAKRGARIVIASRNVTRSEAAVKEVIDSSGNRNIDHKFLDLSKLSSIKKFADDFNRSYERLDVLINNAGCCENGQEFTENGMDRVMQINHVGPTYLTKLLLNKLIASKPSRIIFVSSVMHKIHNFDPKDIVGEKPQIHFLVRYGNSKLGNILTARALSRILPEEVTANSLHPGAATTEIFDCFPIYMQPFLYVLGKNVFKTAEECAQTSVHLAMAPSLAKVSGEYFDECKIAKPHRAVTDKLAQRVWRDTLSFVHDTMENKEEKIEQ